MGALHREVEGAEYADDPTLLAVMTLGAVEDRLGNTSGREIRR